MDYMIREDKLYLTELSLTAEMLDNVNEYVKLTKVSQIKIILVDHIEEPH